MEPQEQQENRCQQNIDNISNLKNGAIELQKDIKDNFEKELSKREEYFDSIVKLAERSFDSQNQQLKTHVANCKNALDVLIKDFEAQNNQQKRDIVNKSNEVKSQINKDRDEFKVQKLQDFESHLANYEEHYNHINKFVQEQITNEPLQLIVGGTQMIVGRTTLTSVKESTLAEMFSDNYPLRYVDDDKVFIDRNPRVFGHMIEYLRNGRRILPREIPDDLKILIENEIAYWKVYPDAVLKNYKCLTLPQQAAEIQKVLNQAPLFNQNKNQITIKNWQKYGPLGIAAIIENSDLQLNFNSDEIEVKTVQFENGIKYGQFLKGTDIMEGIGRKEFNHGQIQEGQFSNNLMNGYVREFYLNGNCYIGMCKDTKKNGKGKFVQANGKAYDGTFKNDQFV